mmetsp:Transcript_8794/g.25314  ORF Transcript_8794/g.25314 Transcript_8794/m.25314 type:complete len:377 (+) Transcript_8794:1768-2898(+)
MHSARPENGKGQFVGATDNATDNATLQPFPSHSRNCALRQTTTPVCLQCFVLVRGLVGSLLAVYRASFIKIRPATRASCFCCCCHSWCSFHLLVFLDAGHGKNGHRDDASMRPPGGRHAAQLGRGRKGTGRIGAHDVRHGAPHAARHRPVRLGAISAAAAAAAGFEIATMMIRDLMLQIPRQDFSQHQHAGSDEAGQRFAAAELPGHHGQPVAEFLSLPRRHPQQRRARTMARPGQVPALLIRLALAMRWCFPRLPWVLGRPESCSWQQEEVPALTAPRHCCCLELPSDVLNPHHCHFRILLRKKRWCHPRCPPPLSPRHRPHRSAHHFLRCSHLRCHCRHDVLLGPQILPITGQIDRFCSCRCARLVRVADLLLR